MELVVIHVVQRKYTYLFLSSKSLPLSKVVSAIKETVDTCGFNDYKLLSYVHGKNGREHKVESVQLTKMAQSHISRK